MVATDFAAERGYDSDAFRTHVLDRTDRQQVVLGYFEPGQFIPVHAPDSDLAVTVHRGEGVVVDGDTDHRVEPGSVVAVRAGVERGIRAETRLEATLVASPPPGDDEHEPVREGLRRGVFRRE
ncbi:MAG: cupin domain-containing protein [Haloferacaceae archaeon]